MAPGPFADEWQRAAGGLLQAALALGVGLQPTGHGKIATTVCISGAWGSDADEAKTQLASAWSAFAHSSAGGLFALSPEAVVSATPDLLTLHVEVEIEPLVRGLKAAVLSDIAEILQLPGKLPTTTPPDAPSDP